MKKPRESFIFRPIDGIWVDVLGKDQIILADVLMSYDILIDDRTQFARLYDYEKGIAIWYRAHALKIELTIFDLE